MASLDSNSELLFNAVEAVLKLVLGHGLTGDHDASHSLKLFLSTLLVSLVKCIKELVFVSSADRGEPRVYLLTHLLTYSLTHLLTHSLTYSLTHSFTHSLTYSLTHLLTHSLTHLLTYALTHLFYLPQGTGQIYCRTQKQYYFG